MGPKSHGAASGLLWSSPTAPWAPSQHEHLAVRIVYWQEGNLSALSGHQPPALHGGTRGALW